VRSASHLIEKLGEQSSEISSIVNVIKSIADQTNLLALNAAIEAARAGEQGRGFSVVADEVRLLAQRTSESTDQIEGMIGKIQHGTHEAVTKMERGVTEVDQGMEWAAGAGDAINTIRDSFEQVLAVVEQISSALREQNAASDEVARNVESIAQMSEQNREATHHASSTAHRLNELAGELGSQVARFAL
jgi:methyl-accepting chemotaxis protein